jgi:excisionase family DNA binding protein
MTGQPADLDEDLLTIAEVCTKLRMSRQTLMQRIYAEQITAYRVGPGHGRQTRYRIPASEVRRYLTANVTGSAARAS